MQAIEIKGEVRAGVGKGNARRTRATGMTPGVLYGAGEPSLAINLDTTQLVHILRKHSGGNLILDVKLAGMTERELTAIIKELQRDPVDARILHVDLQHVSMTQIVTVHVPVHLTGTPIGVKEGGILEHFVRDVEVECQAGRIPEALSIDVAHLVRGHSVHVEDLVAPEGVEILTPKDRVIASIVLKAVEAAPAPAEEAAPTEEAAAETTEEKEKAPEQKGAEKKAPEKKPPEKKGSEKAEGRPQKS